MSQLDRELRDAIQGDGAPDSTPPVAGPPKPVARPRKKGNLGLLITLVAMVGAVTTFFFVGMKPAAIYSTPVDQIVAAEGQYVGRKVRIEGDLVPGTLEKRDQPCEYRFRVHGPTSELPVRFAQCVIPDTFRDVPEGGVQVTVEGALASNGTFEATIVMAKCASKYDPKEHKMRSDKDS